MNIFRDKGFL